MPKRYHDIIHAPVELTSTTLARCVPHNDDATIWAPPPEVLWNWILMGPLIPLHIMLAMGALSAIIEVIWYPAMCAKIETDTALLAELHGLLKGIELLISREWDVFLGLNANLEESPIITLWYSGYRYILQECKQLSKLGTLYICRGENKPLRTYLISAFCNNGLPLRQPPINYNDKCLVLSFFFFFSFFFLLFCNFIYFLKFSVQLLDQIHQYIFWREKKNTNISHSLYTHVYREKVSA